MKGTARSTKLATVEDARPTRERILGAAGRLFANQGYGGVSMPNIAAASGITAGAIYRHFDSKEDLFFEAVVERTLAATSMAARVETAGADDIVEPFARALGAYTTRQHRLFRQLAVEVHYASARNAKVLKLLGQAIKGDVERMRAAIVLAQKAGDVPRRADAAMIARSLLIYIMGLMHMETLMPEQVDDPGWREQVEASVAALMRAS